MTTTVMVLFGGRSSEHEISCATAAGVLGAIDRSRYRILPVGITSDGAWVLEDDDPEHLQLRATNMPHVRDNGSRILLPESAATREVRLLRDGQVTSLGEVDVVLPLLHGPFGEDGTVQGALELVDLPFVGSGVLASALAMDKHFTKIVLGAAGIPTAPGFTVWQGDDDGEVAARIDADLTYPVFVKPARAGSSVGVSKVRSAAEVPAALAAAFAHDDHVLVEQGVEGREIEVAVLEGPAGGPARASLAGEIVVTGAEFYDYRTKYLAPEDARLDCPAALEDSELAAAQRLAVRAFAALGCAGLARVDFFLTADGLLVNEVNTMPGFTPLSMFPRCWQASGVSYRDLITELIEVAHAKARAVPRETGPAR